MEQLAGSSEIFNMYGPTETTVWSTFHPVTRNGGTISIGRPMANTEIYILDEQLRQVPVGVSGELFIGGAGVTRGYLNRPELTAERFIQNPFSAEPEARLYRTGDLARYKEDGTIDFLGRTDHQVKIRGFRIELGEIEAALRQYPDVRESAVSVWEAGPNDTRLVGYFVPQARQPGPSGRAAGFPEKQVAGVHGALDAVRPGTDAPDAQRQNRPQGPAPSESRARPWPAPTKTVPLTEAQREIWYASQMADAESCSFNLSVMMKLRGAIECAAALRQHPMAGGATRSPACDLLRRRGRSAHSPRNAARHSRGGPVLLPGRVPSEQNWTSASRTAVDKPFDLVRGPLLRAQLLKLAPDEHALLLTVHHVVCDGCSLNILIQQLGERYSALTKGGAHQERPTVEPLPFSDFVQAQNAALNSPERADRRSFLAGPIFPAGAGVGAAHRSAAPAKAGFYGWH